MMKSTKYVLAGLAVLLCAAMVLSCVSTGGSVATEPVEPYIWNFDDPAAGIAGWEVATDEFWDHKGTATLSRDDAAFGKGMLRLDVDFTADSKSQWSEPKIKYTFSEPFAMKGITKFTFDIIYNPEFSTSGNFKSKVIALNGSKEISVGEGDMINGTVDMGDGYLKATVSLRVRRTQDSMNITIFSIAGYLTDYKGPVFFDNMRWE